MRLLDVLWAALQFLFGGVLLVLLYLTLDRLLVRRKHKGRRAH